jgi:hypothetical protein
MRGEQLPLTLDDLCVLMAAGQTVARRLPKGDQRRKLEAAICNAKQTITNYSSVRWPTITHARGAGHETNAG